MKWYTHVLLLVVILKVLGFGTILIFIGIIAALLPDIDVTRSLLGRLLFPVSKRINKYYAHRSITHSLLVLSLVSSIGLLFGTEVVLSLLIGYASHLLLDMLNPSGVPLFYPKILHFVFLGGCIGVGSLGEKAILVILLAFLAIISVIS